MADHTSFRPVGPRVKSSPKQNSDLLKIAGLLFLLSNVVHQFAELEEIRKKAHKKLADDDRRHGRAFSLNRLAHFNREQRTRRNTQHLAGADPIPNLIF
jgi:hypothetical protein